MATRTKEPEPFRTVGAVARTVNRSIDWVRDKTDKGLIPHNRDTDGRRLYDTAGIDAALRLIRKR